MVSRSADRALHVTSLIMGYSKIGHAVAGDDEVMLQRVIETIAEEHQSEFAKLLGFSTPESFCNMRAQR